MIDEVYDIFNKDKVVIGKATWTEVHTKGLLHQTVHGILFQDNSLTKTLLKKRSSKDAQEPGKYEIAVAGHALSGESPKQTIIKETSEELFDYGDLPKDVVLRKMGDYLNSDIPNNNEMAHLFLIIHPGPFKIQAKEVDNTAWVEWKYLLKDLQDNPNKYSQYSINAINFYLECLRDLK